uniref:Borealin C-terminal domain-containing protein n=1 Tax=Glossina pallidipes TaxID=7398 RepID=A0A1A9Z864_GLOPL
MPRTKVNQTSKRNRASECREEKLREYKSAFKGYLATMENEVEAFIQEWDGELDLLRQRTNANLLKMKMDKFLKMTSSIFEHSPVNESFKYNASYSNKCIETKDEGYLTEDTSKLSNFGSIVSVKSGTNFVSESHLSRAQQQQQQQPKDPFRTPGPLTSALARGPRRSRSACGKYSSLVATEHQVKNKILTADRTRPHSVERKQYFDGRPVTPPVAFMRWPKPGEMVLSKYGSPVIAQALPDRFANVNIPLRNGVMSLRPKRLDALQADILEDMGPQTLSELRILRGNLEKIKTTSEKNNQSNMNY